MGDFSSDTTTLDRALRAAMARLTSGLSPYAAAMAWSDWAAHLAGAPGRQAHLAQRARQLALRALLASVSPEGDLAPEPGDRRFAHPAWSRWPYAMWRASILAQERWWDEATEEIRGMRRIDADRVRFMARQMLDAMAPSNHPALNPEALEKTVQTGGRNLVRGMQNALADAIREMADLPAAPRASRSAPIWRPRRARWSSATSCSS
jgi:polyhydroxyalkanoate synthase